MASIVHDVAADIRTRLGEPTIMALEQRFGPDGRCLTCGERFGVRPLSVRAYHGPDEIITLVAYHARCAASGWSDSGPGLQPRQETWAAAMTTIPLAVAVPRWPQRTGAQQRVMPVMLVHPGLEIARVHPAGFGDAVSADLEGYRRFGFADPIVLIRTWPVRPGGQAWISGTARERALHATVGDRVWSASIPLLVATLAAGYGGVLIGITCDHEPARLAADPGYLDCAMGTGGVLLGWAPLPG